MWMSKIFKNKNIFKICIVCLDLSTCAFYKYLLFLKKSGLGFLKKINLSISIYMHKVKKSLEFDHFEGLDFPSIQRKVCKSCCLTFFLLFEEVCLSNLYLLLLLLIEFPNQDRIQGNKSFVLTGLFEISRQELIQVHYAILWSFKCFCIVSIIHPLCIYITTNNFNIFYFIFIQNIFGKFM